MREGKCFRRDFCRDGCGVSRRRLSYRRWLAVYTLLCSIVAGCSNPVGPDKIDRLMEETAARLHTLSDVRTLQSQFQSRPDSSAGLPTPYQVFQNGLRGDCASAAVLGAWSLGVIGMPASVYLLMSPEWGHRIAVTDDGTVMISNRQVIELDDPANWQGEVMERFGFAYKEIRRAE